MAEFNIRSDAVDVEQIMEQIRARVREKRGADYTEEQIRELANVKLDRFLDPKNVRSDLLEHYRQHKQQERFEAADAREPVAVPPFEPDHVYRSSRGGVGRVLRAIRRMLRPVMKLFINPGPMLESVRALSEHADSTSRTLALNEGRNRARDRARAELDVLTYEVLNNLVVEMTRLAIDLKNHKMRVESVAARLDFDERRSRALEEIVQYRPPAAAGATAAAADDAAAPASGDGGDGGADKRRRRRRRGRRRPASSGASPTDAAADTAGASAPADGSAAGGDAPAAANVEPPSGATPESAADTSEP